ncbi:DsbA family protein [Pseudomonas typographi]
MCSWCWGFAPVAAALFEQAATAGVAAHLVMGGLRSGGAALDTTTRQYILEHWRAVQQTTGQPFHFEGALADGFVYDTEPACRAVVTARRLAEDLAWPLARGIQQAFYAQGRDTSEVATLVALAEQVGIPRIEFAEAFDLAEQARATQADITWARDLGIAGFPTLLAQNGSQLALLTNGYQPLEALAPLLGAWLRHNTEAR